MGLIWDHYLPFHEHKSILAQLANDSKCQGGQLFLVGVKGSSWSLISHRKLNISIWVPSILVIPPKDLLQHVLELHAFQYDNFHKYKVSMQNRAS